MQFFLYNSNVSAQGVNRSLVIPICCWRRGEQMSGRLAFQLHFLLT